VVRLTIGAFARATRLSPKALRLYDELGLLRPAEVDPVSGYRYYEPAQVERARLIAWLRQLGMPLARIHRVCALPAGAAADEVAAFRDELLAQAAERARLATLLVDHLTGRDTFMHETLSVRYAARSDRGPVRTSNEDAAYADHRLWAVADGMRGPGGEQASAAAIGALRELIPAPDTDVLGLLADAVAAADRGIGELEGSPVTTLTALVWSGDSAELALVHIGDTRAYRLRDGQLAQITHDHSQVQALIDAGQLTPAEAESHPQRALLTRALNGSGHNPADVSRHSVQPGDRYLLCTDGLSTVVSSDELLRLLTDGKDPEWTVDELIGLARSRHAPDNVACVVADITPTPDAPSLIDADGASALLTTAQHSQLVQGLDQGGGHGLPPSV
jgi:protein phosphatase